MKSKIRFADADNRPIIEEFFKSIDDDFFPKLSEREYGLINYLDKAMNEGKIALFERNGKVLGVSSYWYENNNVRLCLTGVAKKYRGTLVLYRLFQFMVLQESGIKKVISKTWSTNKALKSILVTLGFKKVNEIKGDLDIERISEIYEGDFELIREYFKRK